jgi:hypothetical protein
MNIKSEYEILTKKLQHIFYRDSLFIAMAQTDWVGEITSQGNTVRLLPFGEFLTMDKVINITEPRVGDIVFAEPTCINSFVDRILKRVRSQVEGEVLKSMNISREYGLHFVGKFLPRVCPEKADTNFYDMKFVYNYKLVKRGRDE